MAHALQAQTHLSSTIETPEFQREVHLNCKVGAP